MKVKIGGEDFFKVTSEFMASEPFRKGKLHRGIDLKMEDGTPLLSPVEGIVSKIADYGDKNSGKTLFIETESGETLVLGHLSEIHVKKGDSISLTDYVADSGNTGFSTGSHLHLAVKDSGGEFINPNSIEDKFQSIYTEMSSDKPNSVADILLQRDGILRNKEFMAKLKGQGNTVSETKGAISSFMDYIHALKEDGFFIATYGKSFKDIIVENTVDVFKGCIEFIMINDEAFFVLPAIGIMFATFMIGKNKYTKFIIPAWFVYFVVNLIGQTTGLMDWLKS